MKNKNAKPEQKTIDDFRGVDGTWFTLTGLEFFPDENERGHDQDSKS